MSFEVNYTENPWQGLETSRRYWYVPDLLDGYNRHNKLWRNFVPVQVDLSAERTQQMTFTILDALEPNTDPIGNYDLWVSAMQADTRQLSISTLRYGGKLQVREYDRLVSYWREGASKDLGALIRNRLAPAISKHVDILARNAHLQSSFASYAMDRANTGFNDISATDLFEVGWLDKMQLALATYELPGWDGTPGTMVCIISPGTYYQIKQLTEYEDWQKYTPSGARRLIAGEMGRWRGVYFIVDPSAILWNAGPITVQTTVTSPINAGDGAATTVNGYTVGQTAATHYVTVADVTGFAVDDVVQIHNTRTSAYGVSDGVDPYAGMSFHRQIVSIDTVNNRIVFDKPLLWDFSTDLGASVYAYVTKALHIHTSTFIAGPSGVVMGVTRPIRLHDPVAVDDFESVYRVSWDGFFAFRPFRSEWVRPIFHAGYHSVTAGSLATGA